MSPPDDELDTTESEARAFREEQREFNDQFTQDWFGEAADMAGMPRWEKIR